MTQKQQIKEHLKSGKPITPIDALNKYGCFRLGARIYDLRREGMTIEREMITRKGKSYASYRLA